MMRALLLAALILCAATAAADDAAASAARPSTALIERGITDKSFDDVILELDFAITERNFRITGRNTIGKGLRERGYADFPDVEVIHFCNLEYAREVRTVVSLVLLPQDHPDPRVNEFAVRMNGLLREILAFVLEDE